jgi:hypothetical protein
MAETSVVYWIAPTEAERVVARDVVTERKGAMYFVNAHGYRSYLFPRDEGKKWFRDEIAAHAASDAETRKRIASLEKQVAKLRGFLGGASNV